MARKKALTTEESPSASTLASKAFARLREDIIAGRFPAGEKLRVRQLCELYGIGIAPLREALNRASQDGLVVQTDLRGFSTAPLSLDDLEELTRVRCWLSEIALRRSIADGDATWEESVVLAHYRLSRTPRHIPQIPETRNPKWETAHREFHTSLLAGCGSQRLIAFCEQLFDSATRYRFLWSNPGPAVERSSDENHRRIMEATVARQADEAVRLLTEHFAVAASRAAERLRNQTEPGKSKRSTRSRGQMV